MSDEETVRAKQRARAVLMAWLMGAFAILMFAISIAKMTINR